MVYRVDNNKFIAEFVNLEDAEVYALENGNLTIEAVNDTYEGKYYLDIDFGKVLIDTFLKDNRQLAQSFTPAESIGILQKFSGIEALSRLGDIKSVLFLLQNTTTDTVFTQARKEKYVAMVQQHLLY